MTTITLMPSKQQHSYKIIISEKLLKKLPKILKKMKYGRYVIITDTTIRRMYGKELLKNMHDKGLKAEMFSFLAGEKSKTLKTAETLTNKMLAEKFDRGSCILALGGGIVGDVAGFVASTYMRGIDFIQVPTTLLAMTDAAIGGKTGVNTKYGKNLMGTFHQPVAVCMDLSTLQSLPDNQLKNGYAEVIKQAAIQNKKFFAYLEKHNDKILAKDRRKLKKLVVKSVRIKAEIVARDTKESGIRMILNYGHTYGHAIEKVLKYQIPHGYAVAIGMCIINDIAVKEKMMRKKDADRIKTLIERAGLPTKVPKNVKRAELNKLIKFDKKCVNGKQNLIIVPKIGTAAIVEM